MAERDPVGIAVEVLLEGGLVALPTETVYGLAADADNELAVRRIFAVKGRPATHPLIVHIPSAEHLRGWAREIPEEAWTLARSFWPGPLTLVLKKAPRVSDVVTGGQDTVALRVPAHPLAQQVLLGFGSGIAAPSANRFGRVSPTTAQHVREDLGDEVDYILDGGPCTVGVESTIVDLSGGSPAVLRPGGLELERISEALGREVPLRTSSEVRVSGALPSHYAPRAGLQLVAEEELAPRTGALVAQGRKVAVVLPEGLNAPPGTTAFTVPSDPAGYARALYATMREVDAQVFDLTVALPPKGEGLCVVVQDRLRRAAVPRE